MGEWARSSQLANRIDTQKELAWASDEIERAVAMLKLLGNPTRLRILLVLLEGEQSVSQLASSLAEPSTGISQHLAKLRLGHLVRVRREGNQRIYDPVADYVLPVITAALRPVGLGRPPSSS